MTTFLDLPVPADDDRSARAASLRSRAAVHARDKEAWLAIFAEDAVVQDPVGVSPLDETGLGHHGKEAIGAFWDNVIAPNPPRMDLVSSFAGGDEVANVLTITSTFPDGATVSGDLVAVYRVGPDGLVVSLRAFWEFENLRFHPAATDETQPATDPDDEAFVAALTAGAADLPESRALDPMVGTWDIEAEWEPIPGKGVRRTRQRAEVAWILDGRVLEYRGFDDTGTETTKCFYAYDRSEGDYTSYSLTVLSSFFTLERGRFDADGSALRLIGTEGGALVPFEIRYQRNIEFVGPDELVLSISYPDAPDGTYGPMRMVHTRVS